MGHLPPYCSWGKAWLWSSLGLIVGGARTDCLGWGVGGCAPKAWLWLGQGLIVGVARPDCGWGKPYLIVGGALKASDSGWGT